MGIKVVAFQLDKYNSELCATSHALIFMHMVYRREMQPWASSAVKSLAVPSSHAAKSTFNGSID